MKRNDDLLKNICLCFIALLIPLFLLVNGIQSRRYSAIEKEILKLEQEQEKLIEDNKNLITGISKLTSTERIKKIASEELNMHLAETDEIVRVKMKNEGEVDR